MVLEKVREIIAAQLHIDTDIIEIDNFIELIAADPSYASYPGHEDYQGK